MAYGARKSMGIGKMECSRDGDLTFGDLESSDGITQM